MIKTLKTLVLAAAAMAGTYTANAQGPYLKAQLGYGLPAGGATYEKTSTDKTSEVAPYSFGAGMNFGVALGYMVSENAGLELGINDLMGSTFKSTNTSDFGGSTTTTESTMKGSMLRIIPSFVVSVPMDAMDLYGRMGIAIGMMPKIKTTMTSGKSVMEETYSGGMGLGLSSAVGLGFGISDKMKFFVELNSVNMSYAPHHSEITKATDDGKDELGGMKTKDKETDYVTKVDYSATPSDSSPSQATRYSEPFSSVGVNVGIKFMLGGD